jgi:hypothetical protein
VGTFRWRNFYVFAHVPINLVELFQCFTNYVLSQFFYDPTALVGQGLLVVEVP